jgi:hypothetical protein
MRVVQNLCKDSKYGLITSGPHYLEDAEAVTEFLQKHCILPDGRKISRAAAELLVPFDNDYSSPQKGELAARLLPMATERGINDAITMEMSSDRFERYHYLTKKDPTENVKGLKELFYLVYKREHKTQFDLPRITHDTLL